MRRFFLLLVWPLLAWAAAPLTAQQAPVTPPAQPAPIDSFEVVGATRVPASYIISATGLVLQQRPSPRDIQRAIAAVYRSGGFDDVRIDARLENGKNILVITVVERPLLASWTVVGAEQDAHRHGARPGEAAGRTAPSTGWPSRTASSPSIPSIAIAASTPPP